MRRDFVGLATAAILPCLFSVVWSAYRDEVRERDDNTVVVPIATRPVAPLAAGPVDLDDTEGLVHADVLAPVTARPPVQLSE